MLFGSSTLLSADSLVAGNDDGLINLIDIAAARKVVNRSSNTLEDWTYSGAAGETLNKLVADIACLKARENEGVAMAGNSAALGLAGAHAWNDSGIGLEFAINLEIGIEFLGYSGSLDNLVNHLVLGRTLGRERKHTDNGSLDACDVVSGLSRATI